MAVNVIRKNVFLACSARMVCPIFSNKMSSSTNKFCIERGLIDQKHAFSAQEKARAEESERDELSQRLISRLPKFARKKLNHIDEPITFDELSWHPKANKPGFQRRLYASQGSRSGVNPGVCWPSLEELADIKEKEAEFEPSLETMLAELEEEKAAEAEAQRIKVGYIEEQLSKMPKYIEDLQAKQRKREEEERKSQAKREALLQEAKEFFGYAIDSWDPRFKQMQEMKAEEEKKLKKKRRKEEKEKKRQVYKS